ncbi:PAS domain S-box protein [Alicyclobacillus fastidiosus]|uniref:histidine kinase n=1 Tax=Alicyclobacillus fastidiosus TaxID=392011 RepID=A0ABV5ANW0_9BACL|nr:PAS domain S-box protein [Alicyclobacillus fastidiosus]WEH09014.1 PAS domain S-box protein [Alicyclobacillus fastidiosus]
MVQNSDDLLHANICSIHMAAFENHPDALFVLDSDGYYRQYNKKIFSVLGYSEQDYVTARFGDFTPGLDGDLGRQRVQKAACGESQQFVLNTRHRDGSEAYLQTTLVPVTIDGHVWIMGYSKDITKQVKVEQELRENQELLSRALEIAKLGNWSLDFETRRLELMESAQVIFGVPYCILPSSKVAEKIHPNDYDMVLQLTLRSINEPGLISDCDFRVIQQDGTVRYVHTQWTVTTDNTFKRPVLFGTVQDITERKQTEEMLVNSEKLAVVGQLAAGMAHEIRNPLMVAQGFIQLLETTPVDIAKKSSYFELVKESHKQIDLLAEQM